MAESTILCLDVSSSATGFAWERPDGAIGFGLIKPKASRPSIERIDETVADVSKIAGRVGPGLVLMEWSSGKVHGRIGRASGLSVLGAAQGAVRQALAGDGYAVETVAENTWTRSVRKATRAATIRLVYPAYAAWADEHGDAGGDVSDALGLLEWHRGRVETARLVAMLGK